MKQVFKPLVLTAALLAAGMAHANITGTLRVGETLSDSGWQVSDLQGTGQLVFTKSLMTALNAGGIDVVAVGDAKVDITRNTRGAYTAVSATAPIVSGVGTFDGQTLILDVSQVASSGGATLVATEDGLSNTGGFLTIANISVDIPSKQLYADIEGANGVGKISHVNMWTFTTLTGKTAFPAIEGITTSSNAVSGLVINPTSLALFGQSLGLTSVGLQAMNSITDYGSLTSVISARATKLAVGTVPEPSTYALMGLGVIGLLAAKRRKAQAAA
jgi:hypothetical protein